MSVKLEEVKEAAEKLLSCYSAGFSVCEPIGLNMDWELRHPTDQEIVASLNIPPRSPKRSAASLGITRHSLKRRFREYQATGESTVVARETVQSLLCKFFSGLTFAEVSTKTEIHQGILIRLMENIVVISRMRYVERVRLPRREPRLSTPHQTANQNTWTPINVYNTNSSWVNAWTSANTGAFTTWDVESTGGAMTNPYPIAGTTTGRITLRTLDSAMTQIRDSVLSSIQSDAERGFIDRVISAVPGSPETTVHMPETTRVELSVTQNGQRHTTSAVVSDEAMRAYGPRVQDEIMRQVERDMGRRLQTGAA